MYCLRCPSLCHLHGRALVQLLQEVVLQRGADRRNLHKPAVCAADGVNGSVESLLRQDGADAVAGAVTFGAKRLDGGSGRGPVPDDLDFSAEAGQQVLHNAHAAQLALVQYGDAVAQSLGVGEDVGREEYGFALVFERGPKTKGKTLSESPELRTFPV